MISLGVIRMSQAWKLVSNEEGSTSAYIIRGTTDAYHGADSAFNRNEYQKYLKGVKAAGA